MGMLGTGKVPRQVRPTSEPAYGLWLVEVHFTFALPFLYQNEI
jgi:hypothetical protein